MFWQSFSTIGSINNNKSAPSAPPAPFFNTIPNTQMPLVIIGTGNTKTYGYTTNDLSTWEFGSFNTITTPTSICCGNVNSAPLWVVIGYSGTGATTTYYSTTSTNGKDWEPPSSDISGIFSATGWCNALQFGYDSSGTGIFLATGYGGTSGSSSVAISQDGMTWKTGGKPFTLTNFGNNCYYGNGYWVVVGNTGNTANCVMYSSNISYTGNANITWAQTGTAFENPSYGVVYTGTKWIIGTNGSNVWYSDTSNPTSAYTPNRSACPQWPGAIMTNKNNIAVVGGNGTNKQYLYYRNPDTQTTSFAPAATTTPSYIRQIEYITSTTTWVAALAGNVNGNNSIAISTTAQRGLNNGANPWTNIQVVNTNIPVCTGVAAAR